MDEAQLARFLARVEKHAADCDCCGGCWFWTGATTGSRPGETGYGTFRLSGRSKTAHRVAYEHFVAVIPDGHVLDHLCRERRCVNPAHLEAVTHRENILRGEGASARNARSTSCPEGHPYEIHERSRGTERMCRICSRKAWREYGRRKRADRAAA